MIYNGLIHYSDGSIPFLTQKAFNMTYRAEVRAGVDLEGEYGGDGFRSNSYTSGSGDF